MTSQEKRAAELIRKFCTSEKSKDEAVLCFEQFFAEQKIPPDDSPEIHSGEWVQEVATFINEFLDATK